MEYTVIIQCDIAKRRCSGFACSESFYEKTGKFSGKGDSKYISFTCGGCCGKGLSSKLGHFSHKLGKLGLDKEQVQIHLSSCMTTDNHHYDRCPHIGVIKKIIQKQGYTNLIEGTYVSQKAEKLREEGIYKTY